MPTLNISADAYHRDQIPGVEGPAFSQHRECCSRNRHATPAAHPVSNARARYRTLHSASRA